jgi:hypothetical protein
MSGVLELLSATSPTLAALLFVLGLVYRLIRHSQEMSLRERAGRRRTESGLARCAGYVGLFLGAALFLMMVMLFVSRATVPGHQAPQGGPQEPHWSVRSASQCHGICCVVAAA